MKLTATIFLTRQINTILSLVIVITFFAFTACTFFDEENEFELTFVSFQGSVSSILDEQIKIKEVNIEILSTDFHTSTDENGVFVFSELRLDDGTYQIRASADTYLSDTLSISVQNSALKDTINFQLESVGLKLIPTTLDTINKDEYLLDMESHYGRNSYFEEINTVRMKLHNVSDADLIFDVIGLPDWLYILDLSLIHI